jgi:channel protein (hemolysin III family)
MNQLFKGDLLYSRGRSRPWMRGKLHLVCSCTVSPALVYSFYRASAHDGFARGVGMAYVLTVCYAHAVSAVYHTFTVSPAREIVLQKLDYIGANVYIGASWCPMALLAFPTRPGCAFATIVVAGIGWNCVDVWRSNYTITRPLILIVAHLPFLHYVFLCLTWREIAHLYLAIGSIFCGSSILIASDRDISFEIYHVFTMMCMFFVVQMNYSIVSRCANSSTPFL